MLRQALRSHLGALNGAVLRHCRVSNPSLALPIIRGLADVAVTGTYLDKDIVTDRVLSVLKNFHKADPSKVTPSAHFQKDLGLDSLDTVELAMAFEEEFAIEIPDKEADKIMTCNDAIAFIASQPNAK